MSSLHVQCDFVSQLRRFKVQCIARQDDPPWSAKRLSSNFATSPVREVRGDTLKRRRGERSAASDGCRFINPTSGYKIETGSGSSSTKQRGLFEIEEREEDIYERYFFGKDHWNFFTTEPDIGPVVLSLKQEAGISREHFRLIVRSSSSFLHGHLPASSLSANRYSKEDVVTALSREMGFVSTFKQASNLRSFSDELLKMDQSFVKRDLKIGVIYLKEGQATEEEIFTNKEASPAFNNFLGLLGDRVKLKGFAHFRGGLDTTSQQTGDESVYTEWRGHRMMYHVSTLLPNIGKSSEQLIQRKRHIGNDIVCVVFVDGKDTRFDPTSIRSHFLHTYVAVCPFLDDGRLKYKVGVVSREGVPFYKPNLIGQDIFEHDDYFREFLLSKIINAEHACLRSPRFAGLQERTLRQMMSNLILTAEDSQDNGSGKLVLSDEMAKRGSWMPLGCVGPPSPFLDCRRERLEFVDRLSSDLHTAFLDKDLCDVVFVVGDDHMPVYGIKAVLAARSKVLKDVFLRSPVPSPRPSRSTSISRARRKSSSPVPGIIHSTSAAELRSSQSKTSPSPSISSGSDLDRKEKKSLRQKLKAKLQRGSTRATINVSLVRVDNREENEDSRAMLSQTGKTTEGREVIFLYGFEMAEFSRVIEYLHTGCCRMTPLTLPGLVSLAEYLDLTDLQQACFDRLSDAVCMDTVCDVLSSLGRYMSFQSAQTLFERTCEFIDDHPQEFFSHPGVLQLPKKIFGKIMERELEVPEILKFTTCLAWGETNCHPHAVSEVVEMLSRNKNTSMIRESIAVLDKMTDCHSIEEEHDVGNGKIQTQSVVQDKDTTRHRVVQDNDSTRHRIVVENDITKRRRESGGLRSRKHGVARRMSYEDLDKVLLEWFKLAREKNVAVNAQMIQERSVMYGRQLGHGSFSGSKMWLDRWMSRHNIKLPSQDLDLDLTVVTDWRQKLQSICEGYDLGNVFVADEAGLLYRALPKKSMVIKCEEAKGVKDRISVLVACSATGEKLTPFVIGRSENPPCFRGGTSCLPVTYVANKNASVTSQLFQKWLNKVNIKMKREHRSILMLVGNSDAHTDVVRSNVKLVFLPAKRQPCDSGVIQSMKMHYRKQLLRRVLFHMDEEASCASDLAREVNLLDAIMWLKTAWDTVRPSTIRKHFAECGFVQSDAMKDGDMADVSETEENDLSLETELQSLVHTAGTTWIEYANFDQDLPTTYADEKEEKTDPNTDSDDELADHHSHSDLSGKVAAGYLHELRDFAVANNSTELLQLISNSQGIVEKMTTQKMANAKTKIAEFFLAAADLKEEVSSLVSNIHLYLISAVDLIKVVVPSGTIPNDKIMMALAYHADPKAVEGSTLARSARRTRTKRELKQQCELARKSEVVLRRQPRNQLTCDTDSSPSAVSTDSRASSGSVVESPRQWSLFVLPLDREEDSEVGDINKSRSQDMGVVCDRFGNGGEVEVSTDI